MHTASTHTQAAAMFGKLFFLIAITTRFSVSVWSQSTNTNETEAVELLERFNQETQVEYYKATEASWTHYTNLTEYNQQKLVEVKLRVAAFNRRYRSLFRQFDRTNFSADTNRQIEKVLYIGDSALEDQAKLAQLNQIKASLKKRYSTGKVCRGNGKCLSLEPDLTRLMATSRDCDELLWAWQGWRDAVAPSAKEDYKLYVELKNDVAVANDQPDCGAYWRSWYETDDFQGDVERLYEELRPLYVQLHAFVRRKLYNEYGSDVIDLHGPIPAHLLGDMWAESWGKLLDLVIPFPNVSSIDVTPALVSQGYDALRIFQTAEEFFKSLGLIEMPAAFWEKSMIEKPADGRQVVCHASAWDFYNGVDFRIAQCTEVTGEDFAVVHHEMGHIEYYLQYKDQPVVYRKGANPGFQEAVGDMLILSVTTPKHLHAIGLLPELIDDPEIDLNYLMTIALDKIAFLPFIYLVDQWRWSVFAGETKPEEYNNKWWELRTKYQGIKPPVPRTANDFDPAAEYHIPSGTPYIREFISNVLQYQFYQALCKDAGHKGPLHKCDIYQSVEAGTKLGNMMKLGSSKPWPDALEAITGSRVMSAKPIIEFFKPLIDWLKEQNQMNGDVIGWNLENAASTIRGNPVSSLSNLLFIVVVNMIIFCKL